MIEEQIRKAVEQGIETLRPKAVSTAKEVLYTVLDAYNQGFWDAVGIVINSLGHEATEKPENAEPFIILTHSKEIKGSYVYRDGELSLPWLKFTEAENVAKWLYVKSLLPKELKEEQL